MKDLLPDDPGDLYRSARSSVLATWIERDLVSVDGPDASSFLHGQLSQDIESIAVGQSAWSFLLQPHGKVDALVRVTRNSPEGFILDTDPGFGPLVAERLTKFKLRSKFDISRPAFKTLALRGPMATQIAEQLEGSKADATWPGLAGVDVIGRDVDVPSDVAHGTTEVYEALRIESGMPRMGQELDERTIPTEAGINDRAVSFTKGCYTGQELVARIDARGNNVPRRLRAIVIKGDYVPPLGSPMMLSATDTKSIGVLSSAAYSWGIQAPIGLAMVRRDVQPGSAAVIDDGGLVDCVIHELPLVP